MIWLRCFDVALILYIEIFAATATALVCTDGDIRLTASFWTTEFYIDGIVEVCFNNTWGTVCDHNWDKTDSIVVCNQLGYYDGAIAYVGSRYGPGTGPIQMDYVDCVGNETSLIFCPHNSSTNMSSCNSHLHDAGVSCYSDVCYGTIRLIGPESPYGKGRVELCLNKKWGSICDNNWDENDARVVCKQLGFNGEAIAYVGSYFGAGTGPIQMDNVNCIGNETSVSRCPRSSSINMSSCNSHLHDAGVSCSTVCPSGGIRLVGNFATNSKGTVELCLNNTWGTICDYNWDDTDASVVCNQLGYYGQSTAYRFSYFGSGTGPYLMDYVDCNGSETSLVLCARSNNINASLCNDIYHGHDAGVRCTKVGSCAMFTMCCPENAWDCYGTPPTCLCDQNCYNRGDCCRDIGNSCLPLTEAPPTLNLYNAVNNVHGTATAFTAFGLTAALFIGFIVMMSVPVAVSCVLYHKKRRQMSTSPTGVDFRYIVRRANTRTDIVDQSTCTQPMVQNESLNVSHPLPHSHSPLLPQPLPPYPHSSPPPAYPASEYELGCINSHSSSADQDPPPPYNSLVIYDESVM